MSQLLSANNTCACLGESKFRLEDRRIEHFKDAIKAYEWVIAETLAMTVEEVQEKFPRGGILI